MAEWLITGAIIAALLAVAAGGGDGGQKEVRTFGAVENIQVQVTD